MYIKLLTIFCDIYIHIIFYLYDIFVTLLIYNNHLLHATTVYKAKINFSFRLMDLSFECTSLPLFINQFTLFKIFISCVSFIYLFLFEHKYVTDNIPALQCFLVSRICSVNCYSQRFIGTPRQVFTGILRHVIYAFKSRLKDIIMF